MPQGVGVNEVFQVWQLSVINNDWNFTPMPNSPHLLDGLPTDMLGTVTAMVVSGGFVYAAVGGGAASRQARILCHNGLGWHHITQLGTANRKIHVLGVSAETDGVVRLHFDEKVSTDDSEPKIIQNVNSHPSSGVSPARETSSVLSLPIADFGMPTTPSIFLKLRAKATALDATTAGEHIAVTYGKDGEARTVNTNLQNGINNDSTHDVNDFYSNAKELTFSATPSDLVTNGGFTTDVSWTKNSWTISSGVANSASAQSTTLSQQPASPFEQGVKYEVVFNVATQSAGSVLVSIGGTDGTARSTVAEFTETITAGGSSLIEVKATGFTGTIDNLVIKQVSIPSGVSSVGLGLELTLNQVSPATPELQALEVDYIKVPPTIWEWEQVIDLGLTHEKTNVDYETIVTNLIAADASATLVSMVYGRSGTKYVRIKDMEIDLNMGTTMDSGAYNEMDLVIGGKATMTVTEVVA